MITDVGRQVSPTEKPRKPSSQISASSNLCLSASRWMCFGLALTQIINRKTPVMFVLGIRFSSFFFAIMCISGSSWKRRSDHGPDSLKRNLNFRARLAVNFNICRRKSPGGSYAGKGSDSSLVLGGGHKS